MASQQIYCPNCDRKVAAKNINIASLVAVCEECDHVFTLALNEESLVPSPDSAPSRPSGITHETGTGGELFLKRSWFHAAVYFLLFFCIAWDGFLVFWYSMALFAPGEEGGFGWLMILFPICHVAVGVALTYYVVCCFFNRTEILVTADSLHIRHRPVPWKGNRDLRRDEIREIELEVSSLQQQQGVTSGQFQMAISAHHTDGQQVILLTGIPGRQAEYIAWHLASELSVPLVRKDLHGPALSAAVPSWMRRFLPGVADRD